LKTPSVEGWIPIEVARERLYRNHWMTWAKTVLLPVLGFCLGFAMVQVAFEPFNAAVFLLVGLLGPIVTLIQLMRWPKAKEQINNALEKYAVNGWALH